MKDLELNPLQKRLHTLLKLSKKDIEKRFSQANIEVTPLQYWALAMTKAQPITLNDIARELNLKPPSLIPVIDLLEKDGYLERMNHPVDRRKIQLIITEKGLNLVKKLPLNDKNSALNNAFGKMTASRQKKLLELLQELTDHFHK